MKCENCGMGFIITPININKVCPHCGHAHAPLILQEEDNMVKKIWNKIKAIWESIVSKFWQN